MSFLSLTYSVFAQETKKENITRLTDNSYIEWTHVDTISFLGVRPNGYGIFYTFHEDGRLEITENGDVFRSNSEHKWELKKDGRTDWALYLDGKKAYIVFFFKKEGKQRLKLRKYSTNMGDPIVDMDFYYQPE